MMLMTPSGRPKRKQPISGELLKIDTIVDLASNAILFNLCKMLSPPWALSLTGKNKTKQLNCYLSTMTSLFCSIILQLQVKG